MERSATRLARFLCKKNCSYFYLGEVGREEGRVGFISARIKKIRKAVVSRRRRQFSLVVLRENAKSNLARASFKKKGRERSCERRALSVFSTGGKTSGL